MIDEFLAKSEARSCKNAQEVAEKYGKSIAQIALRWSLQKGFLPLPKSVTPANIEANLHIFDFELSRTECSYLE